MKYFKKNPIVPLFIIFIITCSGCVSISNSTTTNAPLNKLLTKVWSEEYFSRHDTFIICTVYEPKGNRMGSESLFTNLSGTYKKEMENGTYAYLGEASTAVEFQQLSESLPDNFYIYPYTLRLPFSGLGHASFHWYF